MIPSEENYQGRDKITRYGWKVVDEVGQFKLIDKSLLHVDDAYQRHATASKVQKIVSEWSWVAFNTISVAWRDGVYWVIDGQHRLLAARKRSDIRELPCMVFDLSGVSEEAAGFSRANRNRKPMTKRQEFKALVVAGDPVAIKAHGLLSKSGMTVGGGREFQAVGTLVAMLKEDEEVTLRIWPWIVAVTNGNRITNHLMRGAFHLERSLPEGQSLVNPKWFKRSIAVGLDAIHAAMRSAQSYHGVTGDRVWADGIKTALNKSMRSELLVFDIK